MTSISRVLGTSLAICLAVAACGGGGSESEAPLNVDYSSLRTASSRDEPLVYARSDDQVLEPLRNGVRLLIGGSMLPASSVASPTSSVAQDSFSVTNVQVAGVDEADFVKYDGQHIYTVRAEYGAQETRNVLSISRTDAASATVTHLSDFVIAGQKSTVPLIYQLQNQQQATEYVAAVGQYYAGWLMGAPTTTSLALLPDRTTVQLLDVRDPQNVSQAWDLELDGWLRASRFIGDTLYVVASYRPRMDGIVLPADTLQTREANELRIRRARSELLPGYVENGGSRRPLVTPGDCLVATDLTNDEGFIDLAVIVAIDLRERRVVDANCLSTNVNTIYVSQQSLYVAGSGSRDSAPLTVLHKFALGGNDISYRGTGAVAGSIGWTNPAYFMDEYQGDLRIVASANGTHRLSVLREGGNQRLRTLATLPNDSRPAPIGKPGEAVFAVRFAAERAYVVTFRVIDPLYVVDLANPADPAVAGELAIPGFSTYLRPLGSRALLSIGQDATVAGRARGVKVDLYDVRDIGDPALVGSEIFGDAGSRSEALSEPHALTFLSVPGGGYRLAVPIDVFATPDPLSSQRFLWTYSGLHLFDISGVDAGEPQLRFNSVIRTDEPGAPRASPPLVTPNRSILHDDSVFAIRGPLIIPGTWPVP